MANSVLLIISGWGKINDDGTFFSRLKAIDVTDVRSLVNGIQEFTLSDPDMKQFIAGKKAKDGTVFYNWKLESGLFDAVVLTDVFRDFKSGINKVSFKLQSYEPNPISLEDWFAFLHGGVVDKVVGVKDSKPKTNGIGSTPFNVAST